MQKLKVEKILPIVICILMCAVIMPVIGIKGAAVDVATLMNVTQQTTYRDASFTVNLNPNVLLDGTVIRVEYDGDYLALSNAGAVTISDGSTTPNVAGMYECGKNVNLDSTNYVVAYMAPTSAGADSGSNGAEFLQFNFKTKTVSENTSTQVNFYCDEFYSTLKPDNLIKNGESQLLYTYDVQLTKECDGEHEYDEGRLTKPVTCTDDGEYDLYCKKCPNILKTYIKAEGHKPVTDEAIAPTCTKEGRTEGSHCSVCSQVIVPQIIIDATGHTEIKTDPIAATCTTSGRKEGSYCTVCNEFIVIPETINPLGHKELVTPGVPATCTKSGLTESSVCIVCQAVVKKQDVIPATGHNKITDYAVAATCTTDGKTEGSHCSTCDAVLVKQEIVPAPGHKLNDGIVLKRATCTEKGKVRHRCTECNERFTIETDMLPHTIVVDKGTPATCTTAGKTEGSHCSECKTVIQAQVQIQPTGHRIVIDKAVPATCTTDGKSEGSHCSNCNAVMKAQATISALGHKLVEGKCTVCGYVDPEYRPPSNLPVPHLTGTSNVIGGIKITWNAVPGATGYCVYRRAAGETEFKRVAIISGTYYVDDIDNSETGKYFRYTVKAVDKDNALTRCEAGINRRYVAAPHMKSTANTANGITITWNPVVGADKYVIYRRGANQGWKALRTVDGNTTSFTDTGVKNFTGSYFRYTVRAVDGGWYSWFESGIFRKFVATPHMKSVTNESLGARVKWNAVRGADTYVIYRRAAGKNWVKVGTVKNGQTTFLDTGVKKGYGNYYKYTVRAVDGGWYSSFESGILFKRA